MAECTRKGLEWSERERLRIILRNVDETDTHGIIRSVLQDPGHRRGLRTFTRCWDKVMENREVCVLEWRCRVEYEDEKIMVTRWLEDVTDGTLSLLRDLSRVPSQSDCIGIISIKHATIS